MNALLLPILCAALCLPRLAPAADPAPARPNIVFILADDLGIDGVSCYGADKRKTPNIDRLAAAGTRFTTCYAAPLCGPSRCALMTGRYAFRTGGLRNQSWAPGGPGAKSVDEQPMAKVLKQAGYATGESGKWRQVGETPHDWGFDEYMTDPTASGWYWEKSVLKNGETVRTTEPMYNPDQIQAFSLDFIERHKAEPFFLYYAMHLVHKPTLHTPDSAKDAKDGPALYDDNIAYMDKQVGEVVAALERLGLREKTLIIFSGDNGTFGAYSAPVGGRMVNGSKGSMLEGGSRVPLIANWPGVTPAGQVLTDLVNFTDLHATLLEIAGGKPPAGFRYDSHSIAPQLRGEKGTPREWAYVQLGQNWYVADHGWKLNERGELYDMSDAPFTEKLVAPEADTAASKAARTHLATVLAELNPAGGKGEGAAPNPNPKRTLRQLRRQQAATPAPPVPPNP